MYIPLIVDDNPHTCEQCGHNSGWDELTVEFDATEDGKPWHAHLSVGCYGGESFAGTRPQVIEWLRENCARLVDPSDMERAIRTLEGA